ncbi:hypothetical protein SIM91_43495 [Rhodococcus opacus]|uniref:hypothetical protein n=1 Tax=Rhodococcus opacus TaxID=37919 RepID=UPI0002A3F8F3|nr:hypothetical protein [Rhodococcus opacus]ELB92164.1 hypothetical protein Rwratislav_15478 [Rhodococcus wratislaviensis IFP 2016]MDX5970027.1 hypothetical protein [Rhodococcus opacus]CAG7634661.1 hypothetical protein E143388_07627 [Rhodococcus opacus]
MRSVFAHQAVLVMAADADTGAVGVAVTSALCTHWAHRRPCALVPHRTRAWRVGDQVHVRVVFAVDAAHEGAIRSRIGRALATGCGCGSGGTVARWQVCGCAACEPTPEETGSVTGLLPDAG